MTIGTYFICLREFPTSLHEVPATNEGSSKTGQLIDVDSSTVAKKTADNDSTLHEFNIICDMVRGNHDLEVCVLRTYYLVQLINRLFVVL